MAAPISIPIKSTFDPAGAQQAAAALQKLRDLLGASGTNSSKAAAEAAKLAAAEAKVATEAAKAAVAQQRVAAATSQAAAADSRASAAAAASAAASDRAAVAALRRAQAEQRAAAASTQGASGVRSWASAIGETAGKVDGLIGTVTGLGGAFAAVGAAKAVYDIAQSGAAAEAARKSFDSLASSAGTTGSALLSSLQEASRGAVANADLIKSSNTALLLLGSDVATKLPQLLAVARASATTLGTDVGQVFDSLVTGISRGSTELIDNAGITLKAGDAYAAYAASIGKSADELTAAEKQQALLNGVLQSGQTIIEQTAGAGTTSAEAFQQLNAAASNLAGVLSGALATALAPVAAGLAGMATEAAKGLAVIFDYGNQLAQTGQNILASSTSYEDYLAKVQELNDALPPLVQKFDPLSEAAYNAAQGIAASGGAVQDVTGTMDLYNQALGLTGNKFGPEAAAGVAALEPALMQQATASAEGKAAVDELLQSYVDMGGEGVNLQQGLADIAAANEEAAMAAYRQSEASADQAVAADDNAAAQDNAAAALDTSALAADAQAAALKAATQAAFEAQNAGQSLDEAARAAAEALFGSGAAGSAAAAQLAGSSAQIDVLTAAYYRLLAAQQATGGARNAGVGPRQRQGGAVDDNEVFASGPGRPTRPTPPPPAATPAPGGGGGGGRPSGGRGGRGGRGGGGGRASEAQKAGERLAEIAADGAQKIEEINQQTAEKLVEIDRRAAEERARIAKELASTIASDAAQGAAAREANDLDLVGADEETKKRLDAREKAEAEAAQRIADAQQKARDQIAAGNAEAAAAEYEAQKSYIEQRQQLDEDYYEKQAELAGNPEALAELDKQYQEAVAALDEANRVEQELAAAQAAEKAQAVEEEKAAVIAAAEEQKAQVVAKAQEQAEGVKGASAGQRDAVVNDLATQAQAVTDWAAAYEAAAARAASAAQKAASAVGSVPAPGGGGGASSAGGGQSAAAGGGTFVTTRPTTLTVGDNPGGMELVTVTPLSGKGQTRVGGGMVAMAGGGSVLAGAPDLSVLGDADALLQEAASLAAGGGGVADQIKDYADALRSLLDAIDSVRGLASSAPLSPIDPAVVREAAQQAAAVAQILQAELVPLAEDQADEIGRYLDAAQGAADLLASQRDLSGALTGYRPPLDEDFARRLAEEARRVTALFLSQVVPLAEQQATQAARFRDLSAATVDAIQQTATLGNTLTGYRPPINLADVREVAREAAQVAQQFQAILLPATEQQVSDVERFGALVGAAVQGLTGVLDLRTQLAGADLSAPIDQTLISFLAIQAQQTAGSFRSFLLPLTEQEAADISRYADAVRAGIDGLLQVLNIRKALAEGAGPPVVQQTITELALEAQRVAGTFRSFLLPLSEQEAADVGRYGQAISAAVSGLNAAMDLRRGLAAAAPPIRDADVERLAGETRRVVEIFQRSLLPQSEEQAAAAERYAGVVQSSTGALSAVLGLTAEAFDAYQSPSDAQIDRVARDAQRIAAAFGRAAGVLGAGELADAAQKATGAARETLLALQALNDQTFELDPSRLEVFERGALALYGSLGRLGAAAAGLPDLGPMLRAAEAATATAGAFTALGALPESAGAGASSTTTISIAPGAIVVNAAPGQDTAAIADAVLGRLNRMIGGRR